MRHHKLPAKTDIKNNVNLTPLTLASKLGRHTIFKEMLELGSLVRSQSHPGGKKCQTSIQSLAQDSLCLFLIFWFTYGDGNFVLRLMVQGFNNFFCYTYITHWNFFFNDIQIWFLYTPTAMTSMCKCKIGYFQRMKYVLFWCPVLFAS